MKINWTVFVLNTKNLILTPFCTNSNVIFQFCLIFTFIYAYNEIYVSKINPSGSVISSIEFFHYRKYVFCMEINRRVHFKGKFFIFSYLFQSSIQSFTVSRIFFERYIPRTMESWYISNLLRQDIFRLLMWKINTSFNIFQAALKQTSHRKFYSLFFLESMFNKVYDMQCQIFLSGFEKDFPVHIIFDCAFTTFQSFFKCYGKWALQ